MICDNDSETRRPAQLKQYVSSSCDPVHWLRVDLAEADELELEEELVIAEEKEEKEEFQVEEEGRASR
eukprot:748306-Hanusia_phi.AAC.2